MGKTLIMIFLNKKGFASLSNKCETNSRKEKRVLHKNIAKFVF